MKWLEQAVSFIKKFRQRYKERIHSDVVFFRETYDCILNKGKFDKQFYEKQTSRTLVSDYIQDYCTIGLLDGLNPNGSFESFFYLLTNQDVANETYHPYVHFLKFGETENRSCSQKKIILENELICLDYYNYKNRTSFLTKEDVVDFYVNFGWRLKHKAHPSFPVINEKSNDFLEIFSYISPIVWQWMTGMRSKLLCMLDCAVLAKNRDYNIIKSSRQFDSAFYLSQSDEVAESCEDPILHYSTEWKTYYLNPNRWFDTKEYSRKFSCCDENPFVYYLLNFKKMSCPECAIFTQWRPYYSVIMPTYNRRNTISMAIDSLLNQTYKNFELIIIDDGSKDETSQYLKKTYSRQFLAGKFILIESTHSGAANARNLGLEHARGDVITYLDTDNTWIPSYLECLIPPLCLHEMAYAKCKVFDLKDNTNYELGMDFDYGKLLISNYIDLNVFAHKTFLIDQSGKFDRSLTRFIDWDFVLRYTRRSAPFFLDKVMCNYHILPKTNSITINNDYAHNYSLIRSRHNRFLLDGR